MPAIGLRQRQLVAARQKRARSPSPERSFPATRAVQAKINILTEELTQKTHALASQIDLGTSLAKKLDLATNSIEELKTKLINTEFELECTRNSLSNTQRWLDLTRKSRLALRSRFYVPERSAARTAGTLAKLQGRHVQSLNEDYELRNDLTSALGKLSLLRTRAAGYLGALESTQAALTNSNARVAHLEFFLTRQESMAVAAVAIERDREVVMEMGVKELQGQLAKLRQTDKNIPLVSKLRKKAEMLSALLDALDRLDADDVA